MKTKEVKNTKGGHKYIHCLERKDSTQAHLNSWASVHCNGVSRPAKCVGTAADQWCRHHNVGSGSYKYALHHDIKKHRWYQLYSHYCSSEYDLHHYISWCQLRHLNYCSYKHDLHRWITKLHWCQHRNLTYGSYDLHHCIKKHNWIQLRTLSYCSYKHDLHRRIKKLHW
ncbi:hypothetical protein AOLI_G00140250 [Acnodon oligacanthus]